MSKQIYNSSWDKLKEIFGSLNDNNISQALEQFKVKEICVDGITSVINGEKGVDLGCFYNMLEQLGFTQDEIEQTRQCVIGDCRYTTDLYGMLNHFIGYHGTPAQNVGNLVDVVKNDKRELPSRVSRIAYNLSHPHMNTD